jgi:biofilm PGA synthesis protein PgaA
VIWLVFSPEGGWAADSAREKVLASGDQAQIVAVLAETTGSDIESLKWRARAMAALSRHVEAADAWRRAAELDPADRDAFRGLVFSLADLGASGRALELAKQHWDWFQSDAQLRLAGDLAAAKIRWMDLPPGPGESPHAAFDWASAALESALGKPWTDLDGANEQEARIGRDRLVALEKAHRHGEALDWSRDLKRAGVKLDPHAQAALGGALAGVERPAAAARQFGPAVKELPWDIETGMGYFYALSDAGRYRRAATHLAEHTERQAHWRGGSFLGEYLANQAPIEADVAAGVGKAWAGDPRAALEWLGDLKEIAPASADLHLGLAEVELVRGRPRTAMIEARRALALEPVSVSAQSVALECRIETGDWDGIGAEFDRLRAAHLLDDDLDAAWSVWRWETAPTIEWEVTHSRSDGVESPGKETIFRGSVRSAGFGPDQRLSLSVGETSEWAFFPEGDAEEHRAGALLRAVLGDQIWRVGGGAVERGGFFGSLDWEWQATDALAFTALGELDSLEAPLRGRRAGVTADRIGVGGECSWFEQGGLSWSASRLSFSDTNVRHEIGLDATYRVWQAPGWECLAGLGAHASWGKEIADAAYFNPESDFSPEAAVTLRHRWRGNVTHEATVFGGVYQQDGFTDLGFGGVRYQLEWEIRRRARLFAAGEWLTHPYDGAREEAREGRLGMTWRF